MSVDIVGLTVIAFILPDGHIVLQRRTADAPYAPGKLSFFGGHIEKGESPRECLDREIVEETSLDPKQLSIDLLAEYVKTADGDYPKDRRFYVYRATIESMDFAVYEGDRAEAYSLRQLQARSDIAAGARDILTNVIRKL